MIKFDLQTIIMPFSIYDYNLNITHIEQSVEKDWKRTRFVSGGGNSPSESTRRKLRAKRKPRK